MTDSKPSAKGLLLVLSGPSGAGETTITHAVERRFGGVFSVSATTRPRGPGEIEGKDYFFISQEEFSRWVEERRFLEYAQVFGRNWYGTPREPVEAQLAQGRLVILDIDVQGAMQVKRAMPEALMVFLTAPNEVQARERLVQRGATMQLPLSEDLLKHAWKSAPLVPAECTIALS